MAAVIIFAIIFTAGFSYFSFQASSNLTLDKANASAQLAQNKVTQEKLVLGAFQSLTNGNLWLNITNVGGVPSTIVSVFVTNFAGQLISTGPTSPYLTGTPYLNVSLPLSIPIGVTTHQMNGCAVKMGCDIGISSSSPKAYAYDSSQGTVLVTVLTAAGNEFSIQYPMSTVSTTSVTGDTTVTVTSSTATTITVNSTTTSTSVSTSSSTISTGLGIGTNALVVQMAACPWSDDDSSCLSSSGFYGGTVLLNVTVTNYSGQAINTQMNVLPVVTGTVPTPTGSCSPSSQNILASSAFTFHCPYSVSQGNVGGTVTFIGYAQGTASGKQITSAESTSNTINVGNLATELTGPLTIDYFNFTYYSSSNPGGRSSPVISHSDHFVSLDASITNTGNASIVILQYSYFQFVRTAQEEDYYIVNGTTAHSLLPSYTGSSPNAKGSFGALVCSEGSSGPNPSGCGITLGIGVTKTVAFAANAPGTPGTTLGAGWEWGTGTPGGGISSGEGINGFVVIIFAEKNAKGNWISFAQTLPYFGIYIS